MNGMVLASSCVQGIALSQAVKRMQLEKLFYPLKPTTIIAIYKPWQPRKWDRHSPR